MCLNCTVSNFVITKAVCMKQSRGMIQITTEKTDHVTNTPGHMTEIQDNIAKDMEFCSVREFMIIVVITYFDVVAFPFNIKSAFNTCWLQPISVQCSWWL